MEDGAGVGGSERTGTCTHAQMQIEGFLAMLEDQIERQGDCCVLPRLISQDSLESLFGCIRHACGGGNHPEFLKVAAAAVAVEERQVSRRRTTASRKRKMNSGATDDRPTKLSTWQAKRSTPKSEAANMAIKEAGAKQPPQRRWHLVEPPGFDAAWAQFEQSAWSKRCTYAVSWITMKSIQVPAGASQRACVQLFFVRIVRYRASEILQGG